MSILLALLAGCATVPTPLEFRSDIDSIAAPDSHTKKRFVLLPGNKDTNELDLQFIEFSRYLEKALLNRGFIKATSQQDGDVVMFLSYGIGAPETRQFSYDMPIWGDMGYYYPYYPRSRYYSRFAYMPIQGVTGYTQRIESYVSYRRYLTLDAYDMVPYRQQQKLVQLWKTNVVSNGESNDLRLAFPYMVTAMQPHIASNTGHMITVNIDEFNPLLRDLLAVVPLQMPETNKPQP